MCQHLLSSKPQWGSCGYSTLYVPPLILSLYISFLSVLFIWEEWKISTQLSHFWADESRSDGQRTCQSPLILHRIEFNSSAQLHVYTCLDPFPWWSGGRHDKQLRNHRPACVALREWIYKKWRWEKQREEWKWSENERGKELKGEKKATIYACAQCLDCLISTHKSIAVELHFPSTLQTDQ